MPRVFTTPEAYDFAALVKAFNDARREYNQTLLEKNMPSDSKPWDSIREPAPPTPKRPIAEGRWCTTKSGATVCVTAAPHSQACLSIHRQHFQSADLRELAEFCTELADQLEGK